MAPKRGRVNRRHPCRNPWDPLWPQTAPNRGAGPGSVLAGRQQQSFPFSDVRFKVPARQVLLRRHPSPRRPSLFLVQTHRSPHAEQKQQTDSTKHFTKSCLLATVEACLPALSRPRFSCYYLPRVERYLRLTPYVGPERDCGGAPLSPLFPVNTASSPPLIT